MPGHRREHNPDVERHDCQHHHVGQPGSDRSDDGKDQAGGDPVAAAVEAVEGEAEGEELDEEGEDEDEEEGEEVRSEAPVAGPPGEEDVDAGAPEEGHVHHHLVHVHGHG